MLHKARMFSLNDAETAWHRAKVFTAGPHWAACLRPTVRVRQLGLRFGLRFATSWAIQSCWEYVPA
jgi:hypothetical protein